MSHRPSRSIARTARGLAALALAGAMGLAVLPAPAGAESPDAAGYWARYQADPPPPETGVPTPPTVPPPPEDVVPPGGLYVANGTVSETPDPTQPVDPVQPLAISALRFAVPEGASAILNLRVAEGYDADGRNETQELPGDGADGAANPVAQMEACLPDLTAVAWDPPDGGAGRWGDRPAYDCDSYAVPGVVDEDGTLITFEFDEAVLPQFERYPGIVEFIIVPVGETPYSLAFAPPDVNTLLVFGGDSGLDFGDGGGFDGGDFGSGDFDAGGGFEPGSADFGGSDFGSDFGAGFDSGFSDLAGDAFTAETTVPSATTSARPGVRARPSQLAASPLPIDDRSERIMAVTVLGAIALALWWVGGMPQRAPRLLGSLGSGSAAVGAGRSAEPTRGIGRFARPRTGKPLRL